MKETIKTIKKMGMEFTHNSMGSCNLFIQYILSEIGIFKEGLSIGEHKVYKPNAL